MKYRVPFIVGAAVGYVLGTKAGRERYEQMRRASKRLAENPKFQEAAGVVRTKTGELADTAKERAGGLADTAKERLESSPLGERVPGLKQHEPHEGTPDIPPPAGGTGTGATTERL